MHNYFSTISVHEAIANCFIENDFVNVPSSYSVGPIIFFI